MSEILGKVEKPSAEKFKGSRKLYLVPLVSIIKEAPRNDIEKVETYWKQVGEHLNNLEQKMDKISKVYHESVSLAGEEGLKLIEKLNEKGYPLIKNKCEQGAELQETENMDLFIQSLDWGNCLRVVMSGNVFQKISGFYREVSEERFTHIAKRIDETLQDGEAGALFISEGHSIRFPSTINVFYVSPPTLDDIHRLLRKQEIEDGRKDEQA